MGSTTQGGILLLMTRDYIWLGGVAAVVLTTLLENLSSKFKPWSWLAKTFGKAVNAEMLEKLKAVERRLDKLEMADKMQDEKNSEKEAVSSRRRIIGAADEIRRGIKFSEERINGVLDDITFYEHYCKVHEGFKNEKAAASISIIREENLRCMRENDYL